MENLNELKDNVANKVGNLKDNLVNTVDNLKTNITSAVSGPKQSIGAFSFGAASRDFLQSNTMIAKACFLLFVTIAFVVLFYLGSKLILYFLTPSQNPYILKGMKDATVPLTITQNLDAKTSIPIYRSADRYDGIEFTYSFWIYVTDVKFADSCASSCDSDSDRSFRHVFHKGSNKNSDSGGIYSPNNCPGVYLYTGKRNMSEDTQLIEKYPTLGMLIRLNVFNNNDDPVNSYKFYDDIYVDAIPIKKWVSVIIRATNQNMVDVYINGTMTKRHKLSNVVKQNYDNIYINMNGGFPGNMSNLKYNNYALGTFEISQIVNDGPNLKMAGDPSITDTKPYYLSEQWFFNSSDVIS